MTSPQRGHGGDVVALLVPLDQHRELARGFHKEDSSTGRMPRFSRCIAEAAVPTLAIADSYFPPSFSKNKQIVSIPWWKFGIWNFSLVPCRLSSGRRKPIIS